MQALCRQESDQKVRIGRITSYNTIVEVPAELSKNSADIIQDCKTTIQHTTTKTLQTYTCNLVAFQLTHPCRNQCPQHSSYRWDRKCYTTSSNIIPPWLRTSIWSMSDSENMDELFSSKSHKPSPQTLPRAYIDVQPNTTSRTSKWRERRHSQCRITKRRGRSKRTRAVAALRRRIRASPWPPAALQRRRVPVQMSEETLMWRRKGRPWKPHGWMRNVCPYMSSVSTDGWLLADCAWELHGQPSLR